MQVKSRDDHQILTPYQKPVLLFKYIIGHFSKDGEWVLDLTGGSGKFIFVIHSSEHFFNDCLNHRDYDCRVRDA
jgi:DNA modification methylase